MVASKTSFVLAAVALSAASSAYAAPTPYNTGSDLATRGFEEDEFGLAARFFDDELEARDFPDVEEDLFARDFDDEEELFAREIDSPRTKHKADSATGSKTPHEHGVHHNHHVPRAVPEHHLGGEHVNSHPASQNHLEKLESHRPLHFDKGQHSHAVGPERSGHFMPSGKHVAGTKAHNNKRGLRGRPARGSNGNRMHRNAKGGRKYLKYKQRKSKQYRKHGKYGKRNVPGPEHAPPSAVQERGLTEDEMVIFARSLGLDDNYFLEERSFEDEYEY